MRFGWLVILGMLSNTAMACQCQAEMLNSEIARKASEVFVFRLVSAELQDEPVTGAGEPYMVEGSIKVVDVLFGAPPLVEKVRFSTYQCCGMKMNVGRYYFAFVQESGQRIFTADSSSVFDPGVDGYYAGQKHGLRAKIAEMMIGGPDIEEDFWGDSWLYLEMRQPPFRSWKAKCPGVN